MTRGLAQASQNPFECKISVKKTTSREKIPNNLLLKHIGDRSAKIGVLSISITISKRHRANAICSQ
jgi:hypothetical protein